MFGTAIRLGKLKSVRSRLTLWNIAALTLALAAVSLQIRFSVRANIVSSIDRELTSMSRFAARPFLWRGRPRMGPGNMGDPRQGTGSPGFTDQVGRLDSAIGVGNIMPLPRMRSTAQPSAGAAGGAPGSTALPSIPPQSQMSPPDAGRRSRRNSVPNIPASRIFVNSTVTFMYEAPWDATAFKKAVADGIDVFSTIKSGDSHYRVITHVAFNSQDSHILVQSVFPLAELDRTEHSLDITLLTTIPLVLLIAGIGGAFLTGRALIPIRQITRAAEQISAEDLSRRLPVKNDDEFSKLARTFNAMLGRLEFSFHQQLRFTADASHELKSPLTVIKANTGLALRSERTPEEYIRRLKAIDKASTDMRILVDDLLLLARADEGRLADDLETISIYPLLQEAAETSTTPDTAQPTIELVAGTSEGLVILGNRNEISRLFRNLLDNALRHTPVDGSVNLKVWSEAVALCISVEDTGDGIPAEHLPHLGERFYRIDSARARIHGGSGLGLAICRSIVESHRGTITFQSTETIGTTVTVTLPLACPSA